MKINGEGQNGIIVQSLDTRNTSSVEKNKRQEQAAHVTQICGYAKHVTHIMSVRTRINKNLIAEFSFSVL